jgi:recombinational DNA repair ATPase RecF
MGLRIERIRILRNGPLAKDLDFEPADLNLIYGLNETGKTYVLESLLRFLFKTGRRSFWGGDDGVRELPVRGRVELSGVGDEPVGFTKTKDKIEDLVGDGGDMPAEPSRLLVVRAGKTALSDAPGGAGRDVLVGFLGGRDVLEDVDGRVGRLPHDITVSDGSLLGNRTVLKEREEAEQRLRRAEELHRMVEESDDALRLRSAAREREALQEDARRMELARRHRSWQLRRALREVGGRLRELPEEGQLSRMADLSANLDDRRSELEAGREKLARERERMLRLQWVRHAEQTHRELLEGDAGRPAPGGWMYLASILLVISAVVGGLLGSPYVLAGAGGLAAALLGLATLRAKRGPGPAHSAEREEIERHYRELYGEEMAGLPSLRRRAAELDTLEGRLQGMEESLHRLASEVGEMERELDSLCRRCLGSPMEGADPVEGSRTVRRARSELEERSRELDRKLAGLGVPPEEDLEEDPGVEWSSREHRDIRERLSELDRASREAEARLVRLRDRLVAETGEHGADSWAGLIEALRQERREADEEYRRSTAALLAKVSVARAIDRMRERENERLAESLASPIVLEYLEEMTGGYRGIRLEDDELLLQTAAGDELSLRDLSTGAREQVLLALRSAMAELTFREPAFMLFDDAFQHSDWQRRGRLVEHCLNLVEKGWQVFYFCMDEDMRRRFEEAGDALGDRFEPVVLKPRKTAT